MASHNDRNSYAYAINYTCTNFNAGVPIAEMRGYLRSNGYPNLEFVTMAEWLREDRRSTTSHPVQATGSNYSNATPTNDRTAAHQPTSSSSSRSGATTGVTPAIPQNRRLLPWNAQVEKMASDLHSGGNPIDSIRQRLSANGYEYTMNDVITMLSRQGIKSFNVSKPYHQTRQN